MTELKQQNPFPASGGWWWRGPDGCLWGPYAGQIEALRDLLRCVDTRTWWQRFCDLMLELVHA